MECSMANDIKCQKYSMEYITYHIKCDEVCKYVYIKKHRQNLSKSIKTLDTVKMQREGEKT